MGSWFEKLKSFCGMYGYDEDLEFEESVVNERDHKNNKTFKNNEYDKNKVVNINATTKLKVILVKPEIFEDVSAIADNLMDRKTVVLNLESTNRDIAHRLIIFLSGVAYAIRGKIKLIVNNTYIVTPYNVDVMGGDLIDELENNGIFFK